MRRADATTTTTAAVCLCLPSVSAFRALSRLASSAAWVVLPSSALVLPLVVAEAARSAGDRPVGSLVAQRADDLPVALPASGLAPPVEELPVGWQCSEAEH